MSNSRNWRALVAILCVTALSGCSSKALTSAAGNFAGSVEQTTALHDGQLDEVVASRRQRVLASLAKEKADFNLAPECFDLIVAFNKKNISKCQVVRRNGDPLDLEPVETDQLRRLSKALGGYASALALVASDPTEDRKAFAAAVQNLGGALGKLDAQIARANGSGIGTDKIGTVAKLVGEAGTLYLEYSRVRFLKEIVPAAHQFVKEATAILEESSTAARTAKLSQLAQEDIIAELEKLAKLVDEPKSSTKQISAAQVSVLKAHERFIAAAGVEASFKKVREAHLAMKTAAEAGLSDEEVQAMISRLIELAAQVDQAVSTLSK